MDSTGNAYVTGQTTSTNFPTKSSLRSYRRAIGDAFVSKFDSAGRLVYSTYLGGSSKEIGLGGLYWPFGFAGQVGIEEYGDAGQGIAVDSKGNAYVTGYTGGTQFPIKNAIQSSLKGFVNAFVTKLDAAGSALIYSTYLGGSGTDAGFGIAVDYSNDHAYVAGYTGSTDFPITKNAHQNTNKSCITGQVYCANAFVTEFNAAGTECVYSTYLGGSGGGKGGDIATGIAVDNSGNAYIAGTAFSTDFPTTEKAFQKANRACPDYPSECSNAFVAKFTAAGTLVYSTYLGGSGKSTLGPGDFGSGIAVDAMGDAYVTGAAYSSDFPLKKALQGTNKSCDPECSNAFVTKFDAAGDALIFSTYLGGGESDYGSAIALDKNGNAYVTGFTSSVNFPNKNAFQKTLVGAGNAFVIKYSAAGTFAYYSSYLGGNAPYPGDSGKGIAVDADGNAYLTGVAYSSDFPTTTNAFQSTLKSAKGNAFVTKVSAK